MESNSYAEMDNKVPSRPSGSSAPDWRELMAMSTINPNKVFIYGSISFAIYFALFYATGSLLATLTGLPVWPLVGLVFLLRLCLT